MLINFFKKIIFKNKYRSILSYYLQEQDINVFDINNSDLIKPFNINAIKRFNDFILFTDLLPSSKFYLLKRKDQKEGKQFFLIKTDMLNELIAYQSSIEEYKEEYWQENILNWIKESYLEYKIDLVKNDKNKEFSSWEETRQYVLLRDKNACVLCGEISNRLHVHHYVYKARGGKDTADNLVSLCKPCHGSLFNHEIVHKDEGTRFFKRHGRELDNKDNILSHIRKVKPEIIKDVLYDNILYSHPLIKKYGLEYFDDILGLCDYVAQFVFGNNEVVPIGTRSLFPNLSGGINDSGETSKPNSGNGADPPNGLS